MDTSRLEIKKMEIGYFEIRNWKNDTN